MMREGVTKNDAFSCLILVLLRGSLGGASRCESFVAVATCLHKMQVV